jgi:hypothetical protein
MVVSKKIVSKKIIFSKYIFALVIILSGLILNFFKIGMNEMFSYSSVGNYLIYCGILLTFIVSITSFFKRDKIIDERAEKIGYKATAYVWWILFLGGFLLIIFDGIYHFQVSLGLFVSYTICLLLIVYVIAYKILERIM